MRVASFFVLRANERKSFGRLFSCWLAFGVVSVRYLFLVNLIKGAWLASETDLDVKDIGVDPET